MRINGFTPDESIFNFNDNTVQKSQGVSFSNYFKDALDNVNEQQIAADEVTNQFIAGEDVDLYEVLLATEEAKMSLQLAVQVRNKLVEAVQELTRMQL